MLWVIFAGMLAVALGFLLLPLLRARAAAQSRAAYDLEVYRDQLAEVGRERERDIIGAGEAAQAQIEIERRMLRAGEELQQADKAAPSGHRLAALFVGVAVPVVAFMVYLDLGQPNLPDEPFAERVPPASVADGSQGAQIADMVHKLAEKLKANPNDPDGWMLLGRSYVIVKRYDEAVAAYDKAAELAPTDPDARMSLGEAKVFAAQGTVTPAAEGDFRKALTIDPKNPGAHYYLALERQQAGDNKAALAGWLALAADSAPDAPWRPALEDQLKHIAETMHVRLPDPLPSNTALPASPPATEGSNAAPGPTAADEQAAAQMAPDDRDKMIRAMVQRLADRLQTKPDDFDGWMRLNHAYQVLGETDKAKEALDHARKLRPDDPAVKAALEPATAPPAAMPPATASTASPGPSAADMQAADAMNPDQRSAMIAGMVQQLADRLQSDPGDFEGWLKLGRAYQVLGRHDEARAAFDKAAALRPNDSMVLIARAAAMAEEAGDDKPLPPEAESLYRQVLAQDPDNLDALWYVGMAELQAGRPAVAAAHWRRLLGKLDPKSSDYAEVSKAITGVDKAAAAQKLQ